MVYSTVPASSPAGDGALPAAEPVSAPADVRMKGEDYQRLKQWKDAVGAPTFAQLHYRRDRWANLPVMPDTLNLCPSDLEGSSLLGSLIYCVVCLTSIVNQCTIVH